jgi:hypothetical protein
MFKGCGLGSSDANKVTWRGILKGELELPAVEKTVNFVKYLRNHQLLNDN